MYNVGYNYHVAALWQKCFVIFLKSLSRVIYLRLFISPLALRSIRHFLQVFLVFDNYNKFAT